MVELRLMISRLILSTFTQDQILTLERKLAMVFQQFNLFGRKTALENVKEGLIVVKGLSDQEATKIAREELAKSAYRIVKITILVTSGGQKQRVALARACHETRGSFAG